MMSTETDKLNMHNQTYEKPVEKKYKGASFKKTPPTNYSPPPSSNGPLKIEKPNLNLILWPPKSTIWKYVFNTSAQVTQFYNVVEDLVQAPCAMSTLEVLQSFPTQRKNLLSALGALYTKNSTLITFNMENYKPRLFHQLVFQIMTRVVGNKVHWTVLDEGVSGYRVDPGFIPLTSHQQKTHSVGPFDNNLRTSCSLTRNSYGVPQNQISVEKRGILLYL